MTTQLIRVVADFICPWCFIGKRSLDRALAQRPARFATRWLPLQLDPSMPKEGQERLAYRTKRFGSAERSREMDARATAAGKEIGIGFQYERITRTPNTLDAHRLVWLAAELGVDQSAVVEGLFRAYFVEGRDIGRRDVIVDVAEAAKVPRRRAMDMLESSEATSEVRSLEAMARGWGVNSVPSYFLGTSDRSESFESLLHNINGE
jgi:predicted DsbA family dithiol-disulfide isomerase